jgi:hypothetical protein
MNKPLKQEIVEHMVNHFYGGRTFDVDPKVNRIHTFQEHGIDGYGAVIQMLDGTEFDLIIKERDSNV